jgi:hypothetical protein
MRKITILLFLILMSSSAFSAGEHFRSGIFLHQAVGLNIWGPNISSISVPYEASLYNSSHGFTGTDTFKITEGTFPADEPNNEWYRWKEIFDNSRSSADIRPYIQNNNFIIIMSDFYSSQMTGWGSPADTNDPTIKSVYNYKWLWRQIIGKMSFYSNTFFVIWTNSPMVNSTDSQAIYSHYFCKWAKDTLAAGKDILMSRFPFNVYVFDFFHKLTDVNSKWKLKSYFATSLTNSLPNDSATTIVAPQLVNESFNAILNFEKYFDPGTLSNPLLISPNDTVKNVIINVTLKWRKVLYATRYKVQIALDSNFTSLTEYENNVLDTFYIAKNLYYLTKYYWRVKCYNYGGESEWSIVRRFTTTLAPPGIPILLQPSDKQTNVSLNLYFSWNPSAPAADYYRLQLSANNNFSTLILDSNHITSTSILVMGKLDSSNTYYWRVKAYNLGGESNWTDYLTFSTIEATPSLPTLVLPQDYAVDIDLMPLLKWNKSARADIYILQLSSNNVFSDLIVSDSSLTDTTFSLTSDLNFDTPYFWRIRAVNNTGMSNWSAVRTFRTIKDKPDIPDIVYPADGDKNVPINPVFTWNVSSRAERFYIQVAHDASFTNNIYDNIVVSDTSYQGVVDLQKQSVYWWRVKASNTAGESDWSPSSSFTIIHLPPVTPVLISPADGDTAVSTYAVFTWSPAPGAETYHLQVAKEYQFSTILLDKDGITDTIYAITNPLQSYTNYYWKLKGINTGGEGPWSGSRMFTTGAVTSVEENFSADNIFVSPNPFRTALTLRFSLSAPQYVRICIYDLSGNELGTVADNMFDAGEHNILIRTEKYGKISDSGLLFCRITIGTINKTLKLIHLQ